MDLQVREVHESGNFEEAIGMSHQRAEELVKMCQHADIECKSFSQIVEVVSKECKHPVELLWLGVTIGRRMEGTIRSREASEVERLLKRLKGNSEE